MKSPVPRRSACSRDAGLKVRRPDLTLSTMDHSTPTIPVGSLQELKVVSEPAAFQQIRQMERNCEDFGLELRGMDSDERGIVHVIGPELGATQPGKTIVCGDSHTSTHGALGALAFGIGTTEVAHVLATQCLLQRKPRTFAVNLQGGLPAGVTAKDIILAIIGKIGVDGGTGHAIEYRGSAVASLSIEERMTICNMAIEGGARTGMFAPDDATYEYLAGRPLAPRGAAWDEALSRWRTLPSDDGARFDKEVSIDVSALKPMVTFGTNPGMVIPVDDVIPSPAGSDPGFAKALDYMALEPGRPLGGYAGRRGFHWQLHQFPDERSESRCWRIGRASGSRRRSNAGRAGFRQGQTRGGGRRASRGFRGRPEPSGASPAVPCAWP